MSEANSASPSRGRARVFFERLAVAHVLAYPVGFLWACASIPLAIHWFIAEIDALHEDMGAIGELVVHKVAWPALGAILVVHVVGLWWGVSQGEGRLGMRRFFLGVGLVAVGGALLGGGSWLWLLMR